MCRTNGRTKRFNSSPPMSYDLCMKEAPHVILSNALDISRNARLTSIVKGQSKEELIS